MQQLSIPQSSHSALTVRRDKVVTDALSILQSSHSALTVRRDKVVANALSVDPHLIRSTGHGGLADGPRHALEGVEEGARRTLLADSVDEVVVSEALAGGAVEEGVLSAGGG